MTWESLAHSRDAQIHLQGPLYIHFVVSYIRDSDTRGRESSEALHSQLLQHLLPLVSLKSYWVDICC